MKNNWKTKKLGEVANILMGQSPPSSSYNNEGKGMPFFQGKAEFGDIYPVINKYCSKPLRIAKKNDILLSIRAPVGPVNLSPERVCIGRGLSAIRGRSAVVNQRFLFYFFKLNETKLTKKGVGSTFSSISRKDIENIKIPLPPKSIQRKIVKRLDAIRKLQELNQQEIEKAILLTDSLIYHKIINSEFNEVVLNKIVEKQQKINPREAPEREFVYVDISSVDSKTHRVIKFKKIKGKNSPSRARKKLENGDIVWSTVRPYLKNIAHIVNLPGLKVASTGFCVLRTNREKVLDDWLFFMVSSDWFVNKITPLQKGAAYPAVSDKDVLRQKVKIAPLTTQRKIVKEIKKTIFLQRSLIEKKEKLSELFESTLNKAMKGELVN